IIVQRYLLLTRNNNESYIGSIKKLPYVYGSLLLKILELLYDALCQHGIGYFHKAGNIGSFHVIYITILLATILNARFMNIVHDLMQLGIHFFPSPIQS